MPVVNRWAWPSWRWINGSRDPLVQQLHSVGMAELVRRQAPAGSGLDRGAMQLNPRGAGRPRMAAGGSDDHAEQRSDAELRALTQPRL